MTRPWNYHSTQDRLRVFVSSRLQECKDERSVVRQAISSLEYQPILFEHIGSRPYPPRDLYLSRLRDSQVMVAIYRTGYGYTDAAGGLQISGLEEEYRFALEQKIDTLFYVHESEVDRDPRLTSIIEEIKNRNTIFYYKNPEDLREQVKSDLQSVIIERFSVGGLLQETASNVLGRALDRIGVLIPRTALVQEIRAKFSQTPVLCLYGPAGIGKTTLAAQLAQTDRFVFVRVTGLAPKELFGVCANAVRGTRGNDAPAYATLEAARNSLLSAWSDASVATLVVDECDFIPELHDALFAGGGLTDQKRLVFTSREPSPSFVSVPVPPLNATEVNEMLAKRQPDPKLGPDVLSGGNPLQIQQALFHEALGLELSRIAGPAGEVLLYLALANVPLTLGDLLALREDASYSVEGLHADINLLGSLVDDTPAGFRLLHAETAAAIVTDLRQSPQRFRFYAKRLIRHFEKSRNLRGAYELAALLGDGSERQYAAPLMREAARNGDWRLGTKLADRLLEEALDTESRAEAFHLMLSLVYPLELMGNATRASAILEKAEPFARALGHSAETELAEAAVSSRARRGLSADDVNALEAIHRRYGTEGQRWDQARLGLELSAIYIAAKDYQRAVDILRPTLEAFTEIGDDYGIDLAQRNLASTLVALPGHEEEEEALIRAIDRRTRDMSDVRRQRAWLCNILVRRFRAAGRYEDAEKAAKEAIDIGALLADESLRAINLVNLGNVYGDQDRPKLAIEAYEAAAVSARACGRRDVEGDASRLVAGILNDFPEIEGIVDRHSRARFYAEHAVALLRGSLNYDACASSLVELGESQEALGDTKAAASAYFEAAQHFARVPNDEACGTALLDASLRALPDHVHLYLTHMAQFLETKPPDPGSPLIDQFLSLLRPMASKVPREVLIPVLGRHLHEVWSHVPQAARKALASLVIRMFSDHWQTGEKAREPRRVLYTGLVLSHLLKDTAQPFLHRRLASSVALAVEDLFVREEGDDSRVWTIVLNLGHRLTITISPLDNSPETNLAGFALAMLVKGFENELGQELLGGTCDVDELMIHVAHIDHIPPGLRKTVDDTLALGQYLDKHDCAVTRPSGFGEAIPTVVFLGSSFCDRIALGEGRGGSLQVLFGLTLVELTFQLLRGEVEMEAIRPKVVSLVRRTLA